jgi:ribonuclease J
VPIYIGEGAARVLAEASFFSPVGASLRPHGFLTDRGSFALGPFRLTPYLVDHSAFDAYALLAEAGGRRLFYSGDLRAHGRKAALFEHLLADPPRVDTLLLEGTRIDELSQEREGEPVCGPAEFLDLVTIGQSAPLKSQQSQRSSTSIGHP